MGSRLLWRLTFTDCGYSELSVTRENTKFRLTSLRVNTENQGLDLHLISSNCDLMLNSTISVSPEKYNNLLIYNSCISQLTV